MTVTMTTKLVFIMLAGMAAMTMTTMTIRCVGDDGGDGDNDDDGNDDNVFLGKGMQFDKGIQFKKVAAQTAGLSDGVRALLQDIDKQGS